ncbi:MAG TPA: ubiquitin-like domain-containing protein [Actinomycetota bacterium]|nr:ubiquitin-like domain-containing protein [Actinomycetota bacterium]
MGTSAGASVLRLSKEVTLLVDGRARTVGTMATSVAGLLQQEKIEVGRHDRVIPHPDAELADRMTVRVLFAKEVTLLLDGRERTVWVTGDTAVEEVLDLVDVRAGRHAYLEPARGATVEDGDVIVYEPAVHVRVVVGGNARRAITNAQDVGLLLSDLGIRLGPDDIVEPHVRTPLRAGTEVRVIRVVEREVVEESPIAYPTEVKKTNDLMLGVRRVEQDGAPGLLRRTFEVRLEDGSEVGRRLLGVRTVREPVPRIILEGTRPPHVQTGLASWYHRTGMVAAHQSLPFGTQVKVTNLATGRSVVVVINDRGPFVGGRVIDLSDDAYAQLAPLGSGTINVRLAW